MWGLWFACAGGPPASGVDPVEPVDPVDSSTTSEPTEPDAATGDTGGPTGFPAVDAFDAPGPFHTVIDTFHGCTVHRPATLGAHGVLHPVIVWGNGTATAPFVYAGLLSHLASHGFVVAAADTGNAGDGTEMITCLDAVLARDADPLDPYYGKIDGERIGASGHSQGGAGTLMAGLDPRVGATAPIEPYIGFIPLGGEFDPAAIETQHAPMLLLSGGLDGIAIPAIHQQPVFDGATAPVVWALDPLATHFSVVGDADPFRGVVTAWFRARLMDDPLAAEVVDAPTCTLCADPAWDVSVK